jgi:hypothetical protein
MLVWGGVASGCNKPQEAEQTQAARPKKAHDAGEPAKPNYYDAQGRLLPGEARVEWLQVPLAFKRNKTLEYGRHAIFESNDVPLDKTRAFLDARMFTGEVAESHRDVRYHSVVPLNGPPDATRLHVSITVLPNKQLQLDIEPLGYPGAKPLTMEEARKALREDAKRAE